MQAGEHQGRVIRLLGFLLLCLYFSYIGWMVIRLSWLDGLASIADDSVNYLVMARYLSPWVPASEAVVAAWPLQNFPPLLPLVLAWTGAANSMQFSHFLISFLALASLIPLYGFAHKLLNSRADATMLLVVIVALPGALLGMQGILSEPLFLFLTTCFIWLNLRPETKGGLVSEVGWKMVFACLLLAAVMLTRSIGYVMWLAMLAVILVNRIKGQPIGGSWLVPVGSGVVFFAVMAIIGLERESHYFAVLLSFLSGDDPTGISTGGFDALRQVGFVVDGWRSYLLIYWFDGATVGNVVSLIVLFFSVVGLVYRLKENALDGYYVLGYVILLLIWPHPGQMVRFFFPLAPFLVIYAALGARMVFTKSRKLSVWSPPVLLFMVLAVSLPSHGYMRDRLERAEELGMQPIHEWFRQVDLGLARRELVAQNQMLSAFEEIGRNEPGTMKIAYYEPTYIAALSHQIGIPLPFPFDENDIRTLASRGVEYVLLTEIHPRKTRLGISGMAGYPLLETKYAKVGESLSGDRPVVALFDIRVSATR